MKLMKKLMKKNNKGMSLVELVCAIAILGLTTTALGGAMVISAKHYQRDSAEFNVQQEAQTATNLIGNLVVDAAEVEWAGNVLTITADGKEHKIYQDGTTLKYEHNSKTGVLAEGVAPGGFKATINKEDATKTNADNVNISLKLVDGQSEFVSNYNATPRNGELSQAKHADKVCVISIEDEAVVEPKQTFKMDVDVLGMDMLEVGGLTVSNVPTGWNIKYENNEIKMTAPEDASGDFKFLVQTVNNKPNSTDKWADKEVQVRVRRVNTIDLVFDKVVGPEYKNGTEYYYKTGINGTNLSKGYGRSYDLAPYEYVDPTKISYSVSTTGSTPVKVEPYGLDGCKVTLQGDLAYQETVYVTAKAQHPAGINKQNEPYGQPVTAQKDFTNPNQPAPTNPPGVILPTDFTRGQEYNWATADHITPSAWKGDQTDTHPAHDVDFRWFIRFKEEPNGDWTSFTTTDEGGIEKKIDGDNESRVLLMDKAYKVQFVLAAINSSNQMMWPHDETLLQQDGFKGVVTKGWDDATLLDKWKVTAEDQYGAIYELPAVEIAYKNKADDSADDKWGLPVYDPAKPNETLAASIGTRTSPVGFSNDDTLKLNFDTLYLYTEREATVTPNVWVWDESDVNDKKWKKVAFSDYFETSFVQYSGGPQYAIKVKGDKRDAVKGKTYRLGFEVTANSAKLTDATTLYDPDYELFKATMKLYTDATNNSGYDYSDNTKGFVYFTFN